MAFKLEWQEPLISQPADEIKDSIEQCKLMIENYQRELDRRYFNEEGWGYPVYGILYEGDTKPQTYYRWFKTFGEAVTAIETEDNVNYKGMHADDRRYKVIKVYK